MHPETLQQIEELVRSGRWAEARRALQRLSARKNVARPELLPLASLARRAGLPGMGLKLLNPIVRPSPKHPSRPSTEERAEYAASLIRVGAAGEALSILDSLGTKDPQVLLFRSLALFTQWRYEEAIPLLIEYLRADLDPYQRLVGQINLSAAWIFTKEYGLAEKTLAELRGATQKFLLLRGNTLELSAQVAVFRRQWQKADEFLSDATRLLSQSGGLDELFVRKWRAISRLLQQPSKKNVAELEKVRQQAVERSHWETVRESDLFRAVATQDEALLTYLYFGTPYESYRKRIFQEFGGPLTLPEKYAWHVPGTAGRKGGKELDLWSLSGAAKAGMKPGQVLHRMFRAVSRDFYRAPRLAELHAHLFPEDYFNPVSSPLRVHQAIRRFKRWLGKKRVPLTILERRGTYRLQSLAPCRLWIERREKGEVSLVDYRLTLLRERFASEAFSLPSARKLLKLSPRMTLRVMQRGIDDGTLEREGASSAIRYRFV